MLLGCQFVHDLANMIAKVLCLCLDSPREDPHSSCLIEDLNKCIYALRYTSTIQGQHTLDLENKDVLLYTEKQLGT